MMKHEFEQIAGYEVSNDDYNNIIEPMYMALPFVTKAEFVKMIDKKRFALPTKAQIIKQMKKIAVYCAEHCENFSCWREERQLDEIAKSYAKRFHGLEWADDNKVSVIFTREYAYPEIQRGCTYPKELIISYKYSDNYNELERIRLT